MPTVTHFAAVGDVHGRQRAMVRLLRQAERRHGISLDLVLQVGDFEPHRDGADVESMDAPARYRMLGDFVAFHQGTERFPWPVYFIAGNHEPVAFLEPQAQGGLVAPNCRYLGRVGTMDRGGMSVAWLGGIAGDRPSFAHFTVAEWEAALKLAQPEVLMLHDWPIDLPGGELEGGRRCAALGNVQARLLVDQLQPSLVVCGHIDRRHRAELVYDDRKVRVCCLAAVRMGVDAIAIFERTPGGIRELE